MEQKSGNWECFLSVSPSHFSTPSNKDSPLENEQKSHIVPASPEFQWFYI